jgi:hypothetical protein
MMSLVDLARLFLYLREAGQNHGLRVNGVQVWAGGKDGDSWCLELVWVILDLYTQGNVPFPRGLTCEGLRQLAVTKGWVIEHSEIGCLVLSINSAGIAHHVGICTQISPLMTIAGNTSENGLSDNGDRCAEHTISPTQKIYVRLPL